MRSCHIFCGGCFEKYFEPMLYVLYWVLSDYNFFFDIMTCLSLQCTSSIQIGYLNPSKLGGARKLSTYATH